MPLGGDARSGLRRSLIAGAVYDVALALFIVFAGEGAVARLGAPLPAGALFFFRLAALPLLLLPALYLAAAAAGDPGPFKAAVLWARGGGGAILIGLALLHRPEPLWLFLGVGVADLAWWAVHGLLWRIRPATSAAIH
jgi:hypothetical protein